MTVYLKKEDKLLSSDEFDEVADEEFLKRSNLFNEKNTHTINPLLKSKEIEENTLKSTQRALALIKETEFTGITTAEELIHQREQLEKANEQLDQINDGLKFSQKQIQGIKGFFNGLKSFFTRKSIFPKSKSYSKEPINKSNSNLTKFFDKPNDKTELHPAFKITDKYCENSVRSNCNRVPPTKEELINRNVEDVLESVKKLKVLATDLGTEIDEHNELLDEIIGKTELVDITLAKQNKEIKKILN